MLPRGSPVGAVENRWCGRAVDAQRPQSDSAGRDGARGRRTSSCESIVVSLWDIVIDNLIVVHCQCLLWVIVPYCGVIFHCESLLSYCEIIVGPLFHCTMNVNPPCNGCRQWSKDTGNGWQYKISCEHCDLYCTLFWFIVYHCTPCCIDVYNARIPATIEQ